MTKVSFSISLTLALVLACLALIAQAAPPMQEPPPPHPLYEGLEILPFLDSGSTPLELQGKVVTTGVVDWSKIVFQSYRHGNWEIYLSDGDGSDQTRLTSHNASDIYPRLNRGCTRIAFASDRTGNYEIYVMKLDGSGLTQLTSNGANDYDPFWSPDGTKLAFQSYRDGQSEIYVMNADGSGQTRLTWDGDYDGMPAWSSDGSKIAFVSRRTGGYRVWVMNADGSEKRQLSNQPYSANPVWSPDGSQIAFDSDGDSDGWQELWVMNADGSNQREVHDPGEQKDAWARSWSPDGQVVAFTRISLSYYQGNWYWTEAYLFYCNPTNYDWWYLIYGHDTEWYPDWQTVDAKPPSSSVHALPTYHRGELEASWSGSDSGGSGLKGYDVQYRDGASGSWIDWQVDTQNTSAVFPGTAGHTYYLRSRARDNAYNVERWPSGDGDTYTTLYTWAVTGTVRDNRGIPVIGANVATTPGAFDADPTDDDGIYAAYVADSSSTYTVTWGKSGYGALPTTGLGGTRDARFDPILPPVDNVVLNWGFESGNLGPGDWVASGVVTPAVTGALKHTGNYAALLGQQPAFSPPWNLSNTSGGSGSPQLAVDGSGAVHVVWRDDSPGNWDIHHIVRENDGTWSSPRNISNSVDDSANPQMVVDGEGVVHVVWMEESGDIRYARRGSDGVWSGPQTITTVSIRYEDQLLAVDEGGAVHLVWTDRRPTDEESEIYYARRENGSWSSPETISKNSGISDTPRLVVDESRAVHVVWTDHSTRNNLYYTRRGSDGSWSSPHNITNRDGSPSYAQLAVEGSEVLHLIWTDGGRPGVDDDIYYTQRGSDGSWSSPLNVSNRNQNPFSPQLAVDGNGVVHVVWTDQVWVPSKNYEIFYAQRATAGSWSSPQNISNNSSYSANPAMALDEGGVVHAAWQDDGIGGYDIYHCRRTSDGSWSSPQNISEIAGMSIPPQLALDGSGSAHVVWEEEADDIYYVGPVIAEQTGNSVIAQVVAVPVTMSNPTLSFLYQLSGVSPTSGSWFGVTVGNGISVTVLLSVATNTDVWTHRWFDLSAWTGQTITLTFTTHQVANQPRVGAHLDEVTLGSAYPDLWVSKAGLPEAALPGEQVIYTVNYGNRGSVATNGVQITDTLPAELTFMGATPPPITTMPPLVWDEETLAASSGPFTIVVTTTVAPSAAMWSTVTNEVRIGAASPELETANNLAQSAVWIGRWTYLPLAMKGHSQ